MYWKVFGIILRQKENKTNSRNVYQPPQSLSHTHTQPTMNDQLRRTNLLGQILLLLDTGDGIFTTKYSQSFVNDHLLICQ